VPVSPEHEVESICIDVNSEWLEMEEKSEI